MQTPEMFRRLEPEPRPAPGSDEIGGLVSAADARRDQTRPIVRPSASMSTPSAAGLLPSPGI